MKIKKIVILSILIFIFTATGFSVSNKKKIIVNYMMYRGIFLKVDNLNNALIDKGYPEINSYCDSVGIGNHNIIQKKIIFGINYHQFYGNNSRNGNYSTKLTGNWELFSFGFILYNTKNIYFYPIFNFGYGELNINIIESSIDSFSKVLDQNSLMDGVVMKTSSYLFEPTIGIDFYMENNIFGTLFFGIRSGYMMSPLNYGWTVNGISISGGPATRIEGFFISFSAGMLL
ncbi:MAG: hypothetical protein FXF47_03985 [Candidatus Mcinerneyibacterium aminivorans]|uniref:Outer membrane beta-barrel protein n=1 Tax=Candidatus Mcinerneyibacterium aminivorans TaxID=2703815 RepID=A0A5D0MHV2_9BACT|nr:MAG: hypothetical protein FXF47_03985 [Candidatus Mcinerneyibacterium aminivorans]